MIELLVVVTIIALLLALLSPALDKAFDAAERARCAARQHGLLGIFSTYAVENRRKFPSGKRDSAGEHAIFVSSAFVKMVTRVAGNTRSAVRPSGFGGVPDMLIDPAFKDFGRHDTTNGWVIGYNYLGGHPLLSVANKPPDLNWDSPIGLTQEGSGQLIVCHNTWYATGVAGIDTDSWAVTAHTQEGGPAGDYSDSRPYQNSGSGKTATDLNTAGGNIGYTNGSVAWKPAEDMKVYYTAAAKGGPAMW